MTTYRISGEDGRDMGLWEGETPRDALLAMYRDAGCDDDPEGPDAHWIVTEVVPEAE